VEEKKSAYSVLVEISGGKKPPGKPQHRWKDNIKIYLQIGWGRGGEESRVRTTSKCSVQITRGNSCNVTWCSVTTLETRDLPADD